MLCTWICFYFIEQFEKRGSVFKLKTCIAIIEEDEFKWDSEIFSFSGQMYRLNLPGKTCPFFDLTF